MSYSNSLRNYKHDITGKFRDISTVISGLDESSFEDPSQHELFHAVHEVLIKMVRTSRQVIAKNVSQAIVLKISDQKWEKDQNISMGSFSVGIEEQDSAVHLFLNVSPDPMAASFQLGQVLTLLPVKAFEFNIADQKLAEMLKKICQQEL